MSLYVSLTHSEGISTCSENVTWSLNVKCISAWGEQYGSGTIVAHENNR